MDNLTHSLFGLAAGQLVQRSLPPEADEARQRTRGRMLMTAGWAASNFPDLDLVLTPLLPAPLGYLLHHRGHTHTLLYALPQMLLLACLIWACWPNARALLRSSRAARLGLAACVIGGTVLHIGFDALNSYGVHPFAPFSGRWLYGDLVFIVEPLFWIAFGVPLALSLRTRLLRASLLAGLASVALFAWAGYLLWSALALLASAALGLAWLDRRGGVAALAAGAALAAAFIGVQAVGAAAARTQLATHRGGAPLDAALTAYPANPLCWSFAAIERDGDKARLLRGTVSAAPGLLPVAHCPQALAVVRPDASVAQAAVAVDWQMSFELARLRRQAGVDCQFAAWLRFARMPALFDGAALDARFGVAPGANFTTLRLAEGQARPCPGAVPAWDMPRADLLR